MFSKTDVTFHGTLLPKPQSPPEYISFLEGEKTNNLPDPLGLAGLTRP
jgi:hypothetical protein